MDLVVKIITSGLMVLVGAWLGVCITAGTALLVISFKRRKLPRFRDVQVGCPMCDEMGQVVMNYDDARVLQPCPLCDGESSIIGQIEQ